jgi:glycosyltransferase 2 family protein
VNRKSLIASAITIIFLYLFVFNPHPTALISGEMGLLDALFESRIDWREVGGILLGVRLAPFLVALLVMVTSLMLRGWRWKIIASPIRKTSWSLMFSLSNLGYMANNFLPFRLGEIIRSTILSSRAKIPLSTSLATVVLERTLDMIGALACLTIFFFRLPMIEAFLVGDSGTSTILEQFSSVIPLFSLALALILTVLLWMVFFNRSFSKIVDRVVGHFSLGIAKTIISIMEKFSSGLEVLKSPVSAGLLIIQTALIFVCYYVSLAFMMSAFDVTAETMPVLAEMPFSVVMMMLVFVSFGYMIPAAPGAIGTVQYFTCLAMELLGLEKSIAQGFAIGNHLLTYLVLSFMGLTALFHLRLRFSDLLRFKEKNS